MEAIGNMPETRVSKWKNILKMAWPLIVANSFWNIQLTIDRVMLGHHSTEDLAAAIAVMGIFWTPMALLQQTAAYVMTFVAQYFGAKRFDQIGPAMWQAIYICLIGGGLILLLIPGSDLLFEMIGHSEKLRALEKDYFVALLYSAMPVGIVAATSSFYTGLGNTRIIMWINGVGVVTNAIFAYIMIFGKFGCPEMGIKGAGYATALASWCSAFVGLYLVFNKKNEVEYKVRSGWRMNGALMKRFLKYGFPSGLQWALEGLAFTVFLIIVGRMANGEAALAASGIIVTIMMIAVMPAMGVAQAASVLVGQHLGEKNPEAAVHSTWSGVQVAAMYIITVGITFLLFPNFYLNWFYNAENAPLWNEVSIIVPYLLMFVALFTAFDSMNFVFSFALKGAGDTRFVTAIALTLPWPLMVGPAWFVKDWPNAIYWAWGLASIYGITQALIFMRRFMGGKWKSMSVIN